MRRSRVFTILLALVLASSAAGAMYTLVSETQPSSSAAPVPSTATPIPTAGVLVATRDITAGLVITEDMVAVQDVPTELRHTRALTSPHQAVGMVAAVALVAGEQILDSRVTEPGDGLPETFAGTVPVGMRAISVPFDEVIGIGTLVQPGDHVDVLAYFELEVKDATLVSSGDSDESDTGDDEDDTGGDIGSDSSVVEYTQYVSVYVVQNVEVLAVSQAVTPDQLGVKQTNAQPTPTPSETDVESAATETPEAVSRPDARSATLAVTPEQAQRLLLASQTVTKPHVSEYGFKASLRLVLRAPGDTTVVDLDPAQLGNIPVGDLLGNVDTPLVPSDIVITHAEFSEHMLPSGGVLRFSVTLKNVSDKTITSATDAPPGYEYSQGLAYDSLGFFPEPNTYRLGLNFAGAYPDAFPYRWGFGKDLAPGESVEVTGSIRLTEPTQATRYWFGIIRESDMVTQDGMGVADITVAPSETGVARVDAVEVRSSPSSASEVITKLEKGANVVILSARGPWFQIRTGENEGWVAAVDIRVPSLATDTAEQVASPVES